MELVKLLLAGQTLAVNFWRLEKWIYLNGCEKLLVVLHFELLFLDSTI